MKAGVGIGQGSPIHCQHSSSFYCRIKYYLAELATTLSLLAYTFTDSFTDSHWAISL